MTELPAPDSVLVDVDGHRLRLTSLDKVLYPDGRTTKGEVLAYVAAVASAILPQLRDRPVTRVRWPHGTGGVSFFEKNTPGGTPHWIRRVTIDSHSRRSDEESVTYPVLDDLAGLTWVTNLSALELHVPQWRVDPHGVPLPPDRLVVDLDPGAPAGLPECARVALLVREVLAEVAPGPSVPVTSGSKGIQLYAVSPSDEPDANRQIAERLAERLEAAHPELVVARMTTSLRRGKVFLDWSQNTRAKTTICPYSLRGKGLRARVAAPRSWEEIEAGADGDDIDQLTPDEVVARLGQSGDLMSVLPDPPFAGNPRHSSGPHERR